MWYICLISLPFQGKKWTFAFLSEADGISWAILNILR